ncbi:MAG: DUF5681 domain-containing protein [Bacteroidia bacterium]
MAINKNSLANLKPAKKGEVRNPKGAPQKLPELKDALENILASPTGKASELEAILRAIINKAKKGDVRAAEFILDRFYGKPKQAIDLQHGGQINWNEIRTYEIVPASALEQNNI